MTGGYILSPEAALDLVRIWRYLKKRANQQTADQVESAIRRKIDFLAQTPSGGHWRKDLTDEPLKFFCLFILDCLSAGDNPVTSRRDFTRLS